VRAPLLRSVEALCLSAAYPAALAGRAVDVLAARAAAPQPDADPESDPGVSPSPAALAALLAALLAGRAGAGAEPGLGVGLKAGSGNAAEGAECDWARAVAEVGAACGALGGRSGGAPGAGSFAAAQQGYSKLMQCRQRAMHSPAVLTCKQKPPVVSLS